MRRHTYGLFTLFCLLSTSAYSQFGLYVHGVGTKSSWQDEKFSYGVGAAAKVQLGKVAIGAAAKYLTMPSISSTQSSFQQRNTVVPLTGLIEYSFTRGVIRPYLGVEAGKYQIKSRITSQNERELTHGSDRFGVAPKLGIVVSLIGIGVFAEGSYHRIMGSEQEVISPGSTVVWVNPNAFWTVNIGLKFGLL